MSREFLSQRVGGLALTESTAVQQQFRHERDDDEENPDTFEERDTQGIYDARHGAVVEYDSNDDDYDDAGYGGDDADEEEDSFDALDATNSAFIAAHSRESAAAASVASASSLEWCAAYLERDDLIDLDGAEDEELVDLRREYGAPLSNAVEHLPTLTSRLQAPPRPDDEKQLSLLREGDESVEDDWDMLGIECDCPCASCRHTFVATDYDLFQQRLAEDASADSSDECECECLCFDPPSSTHAVILDLLEDFLRFRVHLHRVTFATAMDQAQRRAARLAPPDQDRLCRTQYARSLTLLKARARRDLKHLELLEVCANQLGWNQADSPTFSTVAVFCEVSPPGPSLLCGIVIEFLSYFLVHRTTASNFDKTKMATLCSNLALFAVKTGDIDASHRATQECLRVCDRSILDLPLADLVETALYRHVQDRADRLAAAKDAATTPATSTSMPARLTEQEVQDAEFFPDAAVDRAASYQVFQGYWLVESFTPVDEDAPTRRAHHHRAAVVDAPALLRLQPAIHTKSKMAVYREMEASEQRRSSASTATAASPHESSSTSLVVPPSSASSSSSLSCSHAVSVLVPPIVLTLLSESSDGGIGWQMNLELTRYRRSGTAAAHTSSSVEDGLEPYFRITKAGHVNCA